VYFAQNGVQFAVEFQQRARRFHVVRSRLKDDGNVIGNGFFEKNLKLVAFSRFAYVTFAANEMRCSASDCHSKSNNDVTRFEFDHLQHECYLEH
jgi:hypothetical protein